MSKADNIKLSILGLPAIQSVKDFSSHTHISQFTIYQLSHFADKYYKVYTKDKKSGGVRTICQPSKKLKGLQSWILVNILNEVKVSSSCKGFEKRSSTLDNARPHKGASTILSIDLKDFFPTISSKRVFNIFRAVGYNKLIAAIFTNICTYNGFLPQGSPCSPKLANLTTWSLDKRIQGYVGKRGITYTRYADDLTFSGFHPERVVQIIPMIKKIIEDEGFLINESKTRIAGTSRKKSVTGIIVSNEGLGIGHKKYKELRAKIYRLRSFPKDSDDLKLLNHVKGWLSYLNSVDKKRLKKAYVYIKKLSKENPDTLIAKLLIPA